MIVCLNYTNCQGVDNVRKFTKLNCSSKFNAQLPGLYITYSYIVCGILYTGYFLLARLEKLDPDAGGAPWTFRLMIIPGCIILWPVLLTFKKHDP